jgi:hypothetical protein
MLFEKGGATGAGAVAMLFEKGGATGAGAVADCFGTAPVSGPSTLAAIADGFGVTLPRMKSTLHLYIKYQYEY